MNLISRRIILLLVPITLLLAACEVEPEPIPTLDATAEIFATMVAANDETTPLAPDLDPTPVASSDPTATLETPTPTTTPTATAEPTATPTPTPSGPVEYTYRVINTFPHDTDAWTQGLVIDNGVLYEGTGTWQNSQLREVLLNTGTVLRSVPLEADFYGEGITVFGDKIYQLTWQNRTGFVYDRSSFELLSTFSYPTEGWGITHDGQRLIVSDGSSTLYFWDPATLAEIGRVQVYDNTGPINMLNELEYVNGEIFANIWLENRIARISLETGEVLGWIDMSGLLDTRDLTQPADVLNGIAYDQEQNRLYVTGKLWPALFEVEIFPKP